ncbi:MAG: phosphate signaling complex protein PhoU [Solirubrobacterales bacterium]
MSLGGDHIVKSYDVALGKLTATIARIGGQAEAQLRGALDALGSRDGEAAEGVVAADTQVDALDQQVSEQAIRVLALRAPVADDLRTVLTALKISAELERIADLAANIAKRSLVINQSPMVQPVRATIRMGLMVLERIKKVLDAYLARDPEVAMEVWSSDQEVDDLYSSLFREILTYMMEDPRTITPCSHLLFIAKNIERCGDHATNIAEMTYFLAKGEMLRDDRPKHDTSSSV